MVDLSLRSIQNTAILVFANSAKRDSDIKKIGADVTLFEALTAQTLEITEASGLPYYHLTEKEQHGNTFGERFTHSLQSVFDKGYANVIAIGNDSPQLKTHHLLEAHRLLQQGKSVLGPSMDGGFYLIGFHRSQFNPEQFQALPWQSSSLLKKTQTYFASNGGPVTLLNVLIDVDSKRDIKRLFNFTKTLAKRWLALFSIIFHQKMAIDNIHKKVFKTNFLDIPFNKGSPFFPFPTPVVQV
ncbi:DUF2064 domain-containing protein [Flagellimonas olearia]|uniref:DUF2064 domain-containing protein n=1 Tax=Flagellimonas olearia TaxID=552546 RepID=A0A6I1DZC8_9FLAO|nr:DUF2064 domain-containing protein [Allomuricauda olearia]